MEITIITKEELKAFDQKLDEILSLLGIPSTKQVLISFDRRSNFT